MPETRPDAPPATPPRDVLPEILPEILIVAQAGRLSYEAVLFAASLRRVDPEGRYRLVVAEPQPGPLWPEDPRISDPEARALLVALGAEIRPFVSRQFGAAYPYGNKIEALSVLEPGRPFVFFDSDTLILSPLEQVPFDFDRPTASRRVAPTWPTIELYGPGYTAIWRSLYDRFGLDFESSLDTSQPEGYWRRHLYFNAGFYFFRCPKEFGDRFLEYATEIRRAPPAELVCQSLDPWLDQVALPLVIHSLGGGRDTLPEGLIDGQVSCHWRALPLLFARESDGVVAILDEVVTPNRVKKVLKTYDPFKRFLYQGKGRAARALFDRSALPRDEAAIRQKLKNRKLWLR